GLLRDMGILSGGLVQSRCKRCTHARQARESPAQESLATIQSAVCATTLSRYVWIRRFSSGRAADVAHIRHVAGALARPGRRRRLETAGGFVRAAVIHLAAPSW